MNVSGIKLQPGLFRHRIYKSITCPIRAKLWHIKKALSSTRNEILSNIDRNLTGTRLRPRKNRNKINPARVRESHPSFIAVI